VSQATWIEPAMFRSLMAGFPTGVAVVTTTGPGRRPCGMTCSSLCSVTLEPPTVLLCLRQGGPTAQALLWRRSFALNFLHDRAQETARLFASGKPDRFDDVQWQLTEQAGGPHLSGDAHAIADCRVSRTEPVGDHLVVFGEVFAICAASPGRPLIYGRRHYAAWPGD
jgi:flavin reductase (DIM6/NTAB) family NADH-FMN oxidoreductase RutF